MLPNKKINKKLDFDVGICLGVWAQKPLKITKEETFLNSYLTIEVDSINLDYSLEIQINASCINLVSYGLKKAKND